MSPDGKEIWAANARDATVTVIDVATKKAMQTFSIPVKGANRLKFTPDGTRVLISGLGARGGDSSLVVIDASTHKEVKQLNLGGGAAGILIAPDGSRAYIAVSSADKIVVLNLKTLEVTGQINAGKQPDGLASGSAESNVGFQHCNLYVTMKEVIELRRYVTREGKDIFGEWLAKLKDVRAQAKIVVRLDRVAADNFADSKALRSGLCELRID